MEWLQGPQTILSKRKIILFYYDEVNECNFDFIYSMHAIHMTYNEINFDW